MDYELGKQLEVITENQRIINAKVDFLVAWVQGLGKKPAEPVGVSKPVLASNLSKDNLKPRPKPVPKEEEEEAEEEEEEEEDEDDDEYLSNEKHDLDSEDSKKPELDDWEKEVLDRKSKPKLKQKPVDRGKQYEEDEEA